MASTGKELKCPFCGGPVRIEICDGEGNYPKPGEYENDPYSGLGYILCHSVDGKPCPIAGEPGYDMLGVASYDTPEEAIAAWETRAV